MNKHKIHIGAGTWLAIIGSAAITILVVDLVTFINSPEYKIKGYIDGVY